MHKSWLRIICFVSVLFIVLAYVNEVLKVKYDDGIYGLTKFYELEDNTVDVLFLGSSHAFENFNTGVLWDEYGMASYVLAGSAQPMWNTYYYLKESLKTQTPKLIVLEAYLLRISEEEDKELDNSFIIKNTFGLKWSTDKIDSIKVSAPKEKWGEYLFGYEQYHTRYKDLSSEDFCINKNRKMYEDWKGFANNMETEEFDISSANDTSERKQFYDKSEKYYRMTIELAQRNNIPIVVVISPFALAMMNDEYQKIYNYAQDIADEYDVLFVNYNLLIDEMELDYHVDAADGSHLNYRGNQKYSTYLGAYLKSNYEIPDRRGDERYLSWQRMADYLREQVYNQQESENFDISLIPVWLDNSNYWVFVSVDGNCNISDACLRNLLQGIGITDAKANGIWMNDCGNFNIWSTLTGDGEQYIRTATHDFCLERVEEENKNTVIIDNVKYKKVEDGINIVIFDKFTDNVVDCFGITLSETNYIIVR